MTEKSKVGWTAVVLAAAAVAAGYLIRAHDAGIQSERDASAMLIRDFEQKVKRADQELRLLESQKIALNDLGVIANLQAKALATSRRLIALAPILKHPDKVDRNSKESVDLFNESAQAYEDNVAAYQEHMTALNRVVNRANKQYVITVVQPSYLDRSSLSSRRKVIEIIGLSPTPVLTPSSHIESINKGIADRSRKQEEIRNQWNSQAGQINATNRDVNADLDEVYRLYKSAKGIQIAKVNDVRTVD